MIIFNGKQFAEQKERLLVDKISSLQKETSIKPSVGCLVFLEDQGGLVYSQEKKQVANRLGIEYEIVQTTLRQPLNEIKALVRAFAENDQITGIIIQKPWRRNWKELQPDSKAEDFRTWWHSLTSLIPQSKDIDGLHPDTLQSIKVGNWQEKKLVLPATCRAVLAILSEAKEQLNIEISQQKTLIVGRSELLGTPLFYELQNQKWQNIEFVGQKEFQTLASSTSQLHDFKTIVSSTGIHNLISGDMVGRHCLVIDAGFPQGDVDFETVSPLADFITPVPNGVGPVTVISLLENAVELCYNFNLNH
ncbi:MAG: bifunctional 5,10-methylenetetrahydrofolate dehydrogenase/5,10-methenyltetrahydrofolate cyclohydrolase [Patescibacteria group bacterium]